MHNEYGWGLKEAMFFLGMMALSLFIAMAVYNKGIKEMFSSEVSSDTTYEDVENDLVKVAKIYTDNYYYKALEDGDSDYVTINDLKEEDLLTRVTDVKDDNEECSGYIHFYKEDGVTNYDVYIKCPNYTTDGYKAIHDETD